MNTMTIKTSNLGYDCTKHVVETNCSVDDLKKIDSKYGMQYRHQSTSIRQLEDGAKKEGFIFNLLYSEKTNEWKGGDYFANYGNY